MSLLLVRVDTKAELKFIYVIKLLGGGKWEHPQQDTASMDMASSG